jgi:hypothetical protein
LRFGPGQWNFFQAVRFPNFAFQASGKPLKSRLTAPFDEDFLSTLNAIACFDDFTVNNKWLRSRHGSPSLFGRTKWSD